MTPQEIEQRVIERVREDLTPIDAEKAFDEMLDECHADDLRGPFEYMQPHRVLKEMSPTDYRCGFADWLDSELGNGEIEELDGDYWSAARVDDLRAEVEDENQETETEDEG